MDVIYVEPCGLGSAAVGRLHQWTICQTSILVWSAVRVISCFISELLALFHPRQLYFQPLVVSPMIVSVCSVRREKRGDPRSLKQLLLHM